MNRTVHLNKLSLLCVQLKYKLKTKLVKKSYCHEETERSLISKRDDERMFLERMPCI